MPWSLSSGRSRFLFRHPRSGWGDTRARVEALSRASNAGAYHPLCTLESESVIKEHPYRPAHRPARQVLPYPPQENTVNVATNVGITVRYLEILETGPKNVRWEKG